MNKYLINLQLFAGEKTEKATPKRKREARKKGQVLKSTEVNSLILLVATFFLLKFLLPSMIDRLHNYYLNLWRNFFLENLTVEIVVPILMDLILLFLMLLLPILVAAVIAGLTANLMQVGFLFTTESLQFKLSRLNPLEGLKRIFSKKALVEMLKSIGKISLISYIAYASLKDNVIFFPYLMDVDINTTVIFVGQVLFSIMWRVIVVLGFLAVIDYIYQKYEYETSLKMSKQEVKDEYKNTEGDPQVKGKIKERQRQMAMNRMMQEVPHADVVITNPTHFAVAIKYDPKIMAAPMVIAKGQDLVALRIKEVANKSGVVTVENQSLARILYFNVDINEQIPEDLFQAVAEVLAFVYRLKQKV